MAANFWTSTHYRHWLHPAAALSHTRTAARATDAATLGATPAELAAIPRAAAAFLVAAARKAGLRARVASTAAVYFARFYTRSPYVAADPRLLAPVALYLAAKAEEHTVPAKAVVAAAAAHYTPSPGGEKYPYTVADVVRAEFTLAAGLHFDLIVWSPHRDLPALAASGGCGGGGRGGNGGAVLRLATGAVGPHYSLGGGCGLWCWFGGGGIGCGGGGAGGDDGGASATPAGGVGRRAGMSHRWRRGLKLCRRLAAAVSGVCGTAAPCGAPSAPMGGRRRPWPAGQPA